jgi:hypothetical protein
MTAAISLADAAAALDDYFGTRLDADHEEGRRLMADALSDQFGISQRAARKLVDALEQARTIRYVRDRRSQDADTGVAYSGGGGFGLGGGFGPAVESAGHWQIVPPE